MDPSSVEYPPEESDTAEFFYHTFADDYCADGFALPDGSIFFHGLDPDFGGAGQWVLRNTPGEAPQLQRVELTGETVAFGGGA